MDKLRISSNNRYFETTEGKPFVWLADTDWTLPQKIKWDDAEYFFKLRKSQGFTVLQIVAIDPEADTDMRNPMGHRAFVNDDVNQPNDKYFEYLDWIIDRAADYGFFVLLLPIWGELVVGHRWTGEFVDKLITTENAYGYGKFIGYRYKDKKNIIWCLGGDRQPIHLGVDYKDVWRQMAEGLAKGLTGEDLKWNEKNPKWQELNITYHACHEAETGECSTMSYWTDEEAWISFIMLQSGHGLTPKNYELVEKEYNRENPMPVWDGEPAYEMMPTSWPIIETFHETDMVRKRAYLALLAGAFGHTYGHSSVWCSISEKEKNNVAIYSWFEALHSEGAKQMHYLRDFMESMQIMTFIPAQEILRVDEKLQSELHTHIQAAKHPEGNAICAYLPSGGEVSVAYKEVMETIKSAWFFNPSNGKCERVEISEASCCCDSYECVNKGCICNGVISVFTESSSPDSDRILILLSDSDEAPITIGNYGEVPGSVEAKKVFEW